LVAHAAYEDPAQACAAVLDQLQREVGFRYWAVTRVTGATYAIVSSGSEGFPGRAGLQVPWAQTLCRLVLTGQAPRVAPDVREVASYRDLALVEQWQVAAYLSAPLTLDGETLHGTVCAVDPQPQPASVTAAVDLVDRQSRLLSTVLAAQQHVDRARRRAEHAEADALLDPLTGLVNRRGWDLLLEREEQRCRRYGALASVLIVDLDGLKTVNDVRGHAAGDALLRRAAQVLREAVRSADIVARLGGDEFAVLAVETDAPAAYAERDRLSDLLTAGGVPASVGAATRDPRDGLIAAVRHADLDMYRAKGERRRTGR
jgi:diguanylate cyclase (GGDEF)-like protein